MKWEILKGSEKDFEGAPEWAEIKTRTDVGEFWLQKHSLGGLSQLIGHEHTVEISSFPYREEIIAERRPITEPDVNQQVTTEWSGEGLPPVGVRCEHLGGGENEWMTVTVIAISERPDSSFTDYWLRTDSGANFIIGNPYRFRPIRSPEDVARGVFVDAIVSFDLNRKTLSIDELYRDLYDAIAEGKIPGVKLE